MKDAALGDPLGALLAEAVSSNNNRISTLLLAGNNLEDEAGCALANALAANSVITTLE